MQHTERWRQIRETCASCPYLLTGQGIEITATPGDLVAKPRGRWHTFWNAGDDELRVLEIIVPGGIEAMFRRLAEPGGEYSPDTQPRPRGRVRCRGGLRGNDAAGRAARAGVLAGHGAWITEILNCHDLAGAMVHGAPDSEYAPDMKEFIELA
ncbi:cupin domain-containing protein [Arthrobacter sp. ISL-65]|uniref:cupin domain-containing protein n=1 Tax=Arthrobacter sp. ISL-65 TaxID=2819112 RepID=UPI001BE5B325|nr:cupin domain-containing protein [Arthrobacter sp. ISL-65]MBT2550590.1 cupin domain-containing protein [Arthrobacter sp. ISL-65]